MSVAALRTIDRVEILSVMDNSIDVLMGSTPVAKRLKRGRDAHTKPQLRAEHGVSMLVTTYDGGNKDSFLFDTGVTLDGVLHNMDVLEVKGNELHAVVLSHGHTDHTRGLLGLIKRYGRPRVPIVLHPDAYLKRKNIQPDGHESEHIPPSKSDLEAEDIELIEERGPTMLIGNHGAAKSGMGFAVVLNQFGSGSKNPALLGNHSKSISLRNELMRTTRTRTLSPRRNFLPWRRPLITYSFS